MAERVVGERGFVDGLMEGQGRRSSAWLERIDRLVDWQALGEPLKDLYQSRLGEKAFPAVVMLKVVLLQCWHGLSDPAMEASRLMPRGSIATMPSQPSGELSKRSLAP